MMRGLVIGLWLSAGVIMTQAQYVLPMIPGGSGPMTPPAVGGGGGGSGCGTSQPSVTGLVPTGGSTAGGTSVTIQGSQFGGLVGPAAVTFGATNATSYSVISCTAIIAVAPAHVAGVVDVVVTNPIGASPVTVADQYTYSTCSNSMDFTQACNSAYIGAF